MNKLFKLLALSFTLATFLLSSCQVEVVDVTDTTNESAISAKSPLADLMQKTSMNDGSFDNIIDNASCISVVLPVDVVANGQALTINTTEDFKLIERIFDESATDVDELSIVFPITVILADFTEVKVESQHDLEELAEECVEFGEDLDIECLDFVYPITISVYDSLNQVSEVVNITSDEELYYLFASLGDAEFASLDFPITMMLMDSSEVVVTNNEELENLIEEVEDQCDEDDDNDYNDDDVDDSELKDFMMAGTWDLTSFYSEDTDTVDFSGYVFTFMYDDMAKVAHGNMITEGEWETYGDDGHLEMEMDFGDAYPLELLDEDWSVLSYSDSLIKLKGEYETYVTFALHEGMGGDSTQTVSDIIIDGNWEVAHYSDSTIDETNNYDGFVLVFAADGTVTATNTTDTVSGTWTEVYDGMNHLFVLDFDAVVPFDKFNEDWTVVTYTDSRVELSYTNDSGGVDKLVFEKLM